MFGGGQDLDEVSARTRLRLTIKRFSSETADANKDVKMIHIQTDNPVHQNIELIIFCSFQMKRIRGGRRVGASVDGLKPSSC
jgi:hypothetical protein